MSKIDESLPFLPVNIALLTVSDSRTRETDKSGNLLQEMIERDGHQVVTREIRRDEASEIEAFLRNCIADEQVDCVISTGGTGVTGRDVTPEAFSRVMDKEIEGFGELFRWLSFEEIGASTIQSRCTAGVANGTLVFALPGSTGACRTAWDRILASQLDARTKPCNFVSLIPRMRETAPSR